MGKRVLIDLLDIFLILILSIINKLPQTVILMDVTNHFINNKQINTFFLVNNHV